MPSSVSMGYAAWMDGETWNALLGRQAHIAATFLNSPAAQVTGGVLPSGGALAITAGSGMTVNAATGYAVVPNTSGSTQGGYLCPAMSATTGLTIAASDPVNARIDLACATVSDLGTSSSAWILQIITGTAAPSPVAPATPANSVALAQVRVPAGSSSVSGGNITDVRVFTAAQGGVVPVRNLAAALTGLPGYNGMYIHDQSSQRLARYTSAAAVAQAVVLPFTPQSADGAAFFFNGTQHTTASVTVTPDGSTDLEIIVSWDSIVPGASPGRSNWFVYLDSTQIRDVQITPAQSIGANGGGGGFTHITNSGRGDRPTSGTHTVSIQYLDNFGVPGAATHVLNSYLYVRPVIL